MQPCYFFVPYPSATELVPISKAPINKMSPGINSKLTRQPTMSDLKKYGLYASDEIHQVTALYVLRPSDYPRTSMAVYSPARSASDPNGHHHPDRIRLRRGQSEQAVAHTHPSGNSGRFDVSGATGSLYLPRRFSWDSHRARHSARMRSSRAGRRVRSRGPRPGRGLPR